MMIGVARSAMIPTSYLAVLVWQKIHGGTPSWSWFTDSRAGRDCQPQGDVLWAATATRMAVRLTLSCRQHRGGPLSLPRRQWQAIMVVITMVFVEVDQVANALVIAAAIVATLVTGGGGSLHLGILNILCRSSSNFSRRLNLIWMRWLTTGHGGSVTVRRLSKLVTVLLNASRGEWGKLHRARITLL